MSLFDRLLEKRFYASLQAVPQSKKYAGNLDLMVADLEDSFRLSFSSLLERDSRIRISNLGMGCYHLHSRKLNGSLINRMLDLDNPGVVFKAIPELENMEDDEELLKLCEFPLWVLCPLSNGAVEIKRVI